MKYTVSLAAAKDVATVGGKSAVLGELRRKKFPVLAGFVITAKTFEEFLESIPNNAALEQDAKALQSLILKTPLPKHLELELSKQFKALRCKTVVVRSSGVDEDGRMRSWAGQLESYASVTQTTLALHVKKCWASVFGTRALAYAKKRGSIAVLVQPMLQTDIAGVAFSIDPSQKENMIVEAAKGAASRVMQGAVTPVRYVIRRKGLCSDANKKPLTTQQVHKLAMIVLRIEQQLGYPVDVEWGIVKGRLFILQARAITAL